MHFYTILTKYIIATHSGLYFYSTLKTYMLYKIVNYVVQYKLHIYKQILTSVAFCIMMTGYCWQQSHWIYSSVLTIMTILLTLTTDSIEYMFVPCMTLNSAQSHSMQWTLFCSLASMHSSSVGFYDNIHKTNNAIW